MHSAIDSESGKLTAATSGFVLAAAIAVLLNTVLSCAKDAYAPLKAVMRSLAGHDWTAQGFIDLALFVGLGLIFASTRVAQRMAPSRLIAALIVAVAISAVALGLWFAFF